jgi:hypothetical protein
MLAILEQTGHDTLENITWAEMHEKRREINDDFRRDLKHPG